MDLSALALPPSKFELLLWDWLLPLLAVLLAVLAAAAVGRGVPLRADDAFTPGDESRGQSWRRLLRRSVQALAFLASVAAAVLLDRAWHGEPRGFRVIAQTATMVAGLWLGFNILDTLARRSRERLHQHGRASAAAVLPVLGRVLKAVWAAIVVLLYLDNMGMNVSALVAGLGVGGLAVALAGQKTIENLFGGIVLALDQPVRVGDFCRFGDKVGMVEDIGFRSIKIRTPERTLITVPNGDFSQMQIENFAQRDCIILSAVLRLRYDTPAAQLQSVLARAEEVLKAHARVDANLARRARLNGLGSYSLDLEVLCYVSTADWEEYLLLRQEILLALLGAVEAAGAKLAYPTETQVVEGAH